MEIKRTANAGVLLTLDGVRILLDGVCEEYPPYLGTLPGVREQLLEHKADVVAFTHRHPDHCDVSFVSEYLQKTAGPIMGPADIPFSTTSVQTVQGVKITAVPSRHIGRTDDVQHQSYVIQGSHCVWFMGDASPLQFKERQDLPRPDVLIAPFAYATCGGWDITKLLSPKVLVLLHLPEENNDPHGLWKQVRTAAGKGDGPAVYVPSLGQKIQLAK